MLQYLTRWLQRTLAVSVVAFAAPAFPFGPGVSDFSARLAGGYRLHCSSAHQISVVPDRGWNDATPVIPTKVIECAVGRHFILAKRQGMKEGSDVSQPDPSVFDYWILNTAGPSVIGPMTLEEFGTRRKVLGIADSVVLKDVYSFRYHEIRDMILNLKPADLGETDDSKVLFVVMDAGYANANVTLAVRFGGHASLSASDGGLSALGNGTLARLDRRKPDPLC